MFSLLTSWGRRAHLGVAIGEKWINLALVRPGSNGYRIVASHSLARKNQADLPSLVKKFGWHGLPCTLAVKDELIESRTLTLPPMSRSQLKRLVAREVSALEREDRLVAWRNTASGEDGDHAITLRSVNKKTALEWIQMAMDAGLVPKNIVPRSTGFTTATMRREDFNSDELISLLDIWDHHSDLVLVRNGEQLYHRHFGRGWVGTEFDAPKGRRDPHDMGSQPSQPSQPSKGSLAPHDPQDSGVGADSAETSEPAFGEVSLPRPEVSAVNEAPAQAATINAAPEPAAAQPSEDGPPPSWEKLREEIRRTHLYANKNLHVGTVAREVLTGPIDPAQIAWLQNNMGDRVVPLSEYRSDLTWDVTPDPRHVVAVGTALNGFGSLPASDRLIPAQMTRRNAHAALAPAAGALATCLFVLALMGLWSDARALSDQRHQVDNLRNAMNRIETANNGTLQTEGTALEAALIELPSPFPGSPLLAVLGTSLPTRAHLNYLQAKWQDQWQVLLEGDFDARPVTALRGLGKLATSLNNSGLFEQVTLMPVTAGEANTRFSIELTMKEPHDQPS